MTAPTGPAAPSSNPRPRDDRSHANQEASYERADPSVVKVRASLGSAGTSWTAGGSMVGATFGEAVCNLGTRR